MAKTLKKIWSIVNGILIAIVLVLAMLLVGTRLFGVKPYVVLSGSMEPTYLTGSMIYVVDVDTASMEVGDPVTFYLDKARTTVATHRIIEVIEDKSNPDAKYYRTKGDNNDEADTDPVHSSNVIGKPVFSIPYLGYLANFVQTQPGRSVALIGCAVVLLLAFIPDLIFGIKGDEEKSENENDEPQSTEDKPQGS